MERAIQRREKARSVDSRTTSHGILLQTFEPKGFIMYFLIAIENRCAVGLLAAVVARQLKECFRQVAVAGGILGKIILVVFLCTIEICQWLHFYL